MSKFTYYWKTPDNVRHEDVIEAADRGAAFAALRERGIRPIKVEQQGGEKGSPSGVRKRVVAAIVVAVAILAGGVAFFLGRSAPDVAPQTVMTPQGPVTFTVASPLARQRIPGDRVRIENMPTNLFAYAIEFHLARFAEPGRPLPTLREGEAEQLAAKLNLKDLTAPIRLASNDFTEYIDLKRIVVGMKKEMRAYIAGGGTTEQYLVELVKRQRQELAFRHRAEKRLNELLASRVSPLDSRPPNSEPSSFAKATADRRTTSHEPRTTNHEPSSFAKATADRRATNLEQAYAYWLKANAQLNSMGIYPLPLPESLRAYQMSVDIEE